MSVNKAIILGNVGKDPEIRNFSNGGRVASFSVATSESWKDKVTGEKKTVTEWHNIQVFGGLVSIVESYVKKGSKLYLEGAIKTRSFETSTGEKKYTTEIVLNGFGSKLELIDSISNAGSESFKKSEPVEAPIEDDDYEDSIPF